VLVLHSIVGGRCTCGQEGCKAGKHPRIANWPEAATIDEAIIESWSVRWPDANFAVLTGAESGFWALDPDGPEGLAALAELEQRNGALPRTVMVRTGGGGRHYYFAYPAEGGVPSRQRVDGLNIDIKGIGGYVVVPPACHLSGREYAWEISLDEAAPAPAPDWLLAWVRDTGKEARGPRSDPGGEIGNGRLFTVGAGGRPSARVRAIRYIETCPPAISGQRGHDQTYAVARAVVYGFDLGPEIGYDLLSVFYNPRCKPEWSESELRHKCHDAHIDPFDKPRGYLLDADERPAPAGIGAGAGDEDIESLPMPAPPPWPVLHPDAMQGLAGEIVRAIEPQTEADTVAVLGQLLLGFGNMIGRSPYYAIEGGRHHTNLNLVLAGRTSVGRKGTSWERALQVLEPADPGWAANCHQSGLVSGEGLVYFVRDPSEKVNDEGEPLDPGVADKRMLVVEEEFSQVLRVLRRESNTLSTFLRNAWGRGNLGNMSKKNSCRATDAHISIIGHIPEAELMEYLDRVEIYNGFANRFLWLRVRRSKLLPNGGADLDLSQFEPRLHHAVEAARVVGRMTQSRAANALWEEVYAGLSADRPGLYGAVVGRAAPQVHRLSMVYALFAGRGAIIEEEHLRAGLAFWAYADTSAQQIFGVENEDPRVALILARLRATPDGMTRTELHALFNRKLRAATLLGFLALLQNRGEIDAVTTPARQGQPAVERWFAVRHDTNGPPPTQRAKNELVESVELVDASGERSEVSVDPTFANRPVDFTNSTNSTNSLFATTDGISPAEPSPPARNDEGTDSPGCLDLPAPIPTENGREVWRI
jgi:hypothetical protein